MKFSLVMLGLFTAAMFSIAVSCYPWVGGLSLFLSFATLLLRESQTLQAAISLTFLCPVGAWYCFWSSKGKEKSYREELMAVSAIAPFLVVFVFLPSAKSSPSWVSINWEMAVILLWASNAIASTLIRDWIWMRGGRISDS
jgi:hypothetical protein